MDLFPSIRAQREQILAIAKKHGATNVRAFGSAVRSDARIDSDLDLLVDIQGEVSPWFPVRLIEELRQLLNRDIDIVTTRALNPRLRDKILREARPL